MTQEEIQSMGMVGTSTLESNENVNENETVNEGTESNENLNNENESEKTVEETLKELDEQTQAQRDAEISRQREAEAQKKVEEFFGKNSEEEKEEKEEEEIPKEEEEKVNENESEELTKAREVVKTVHTINKRLEDELAKANDIKTKLTVDVMQKESEIAALNEKIQQLSNSKAELQSDYIKVDDPRLRYYAHINKQLDTDPKNEKMVQSKIDYLIDEILIQHPHVDPLDLRKMLNERKKEEEAELPSQPVSDFHKSAKDISDEQIKIQKKNQLLNSISGRKRTRI